MNGGNVGKYIRLDQIFIFFFLSSHFSPAKKKYPAWKRFRFLTLSIKNSAKVFLVHSGLHKEEKLGEICVSTFK